MNCVDKLLRMRCVLRDCDELGACAVICDEEKGVVSKAKTSKWEDNVYFKWYNELFRRLCIVFTTLGVVVVVLALGGRAVGGINSGKRKKLFFCC